MASLTVLPSAIVNVTQPLFRWTTSKGLTSGSADAMTFAGTIVPFPLSYFPWYHSHEVSLIPGFSDLHLALAAPIIAYWAYALVFQWMDYSGLFERLRIHEPEEITQRNKVTVASVVKMVILQHTLQTAFGLLALEQEASGPIDHRTPQLTYAYWLIRLARIFMQKERADKLMAMYGGNVVAFLYWWAAPTVQFAFASFLLDTWQYFVHRLFHTNKYLYRQFHSWHHRLYVPYAFGALYNHPFEGLLFDTGGAALAHFVACLTTRQDILLFTVSSLKTVDDHCGFNLPWDPFQFLFGNNADYHDIHHQQFGIKKNFSQPYFTHWDSILGTRMTRDQAPRRRHTDQRDPLVKKGQAVPSMPNLKKDL